MCTLCAVFSFLRTDSVLMTAQRDREGLEKPGRKSDGENEGKMK